jgi:EAL domain-containing protein (putative c-di-GMP-specific phosphodiesterase class I)
VKGIMALANTLGIAVACEGVETTEQVEFLKQAGAKVLQGVVFAKPMPLAETVLVAGIGPLAGASEPDRRSVEPVG